MDDDRLRKFALFAALSHLTQELTSMAEARTLVTDDELDRVEAIAESLNVGPDESPPEFIPLVKRMFRESLDELLTEVPPNASE